ncbi:hypothetical protein LEP1GSC171_2466 [Leptospira santarosai str. HAI1380]|nr:hypothetical protein LEP1GSC175_0145 [Leptospira santarosai str. HAI821]EMP03967.1 hypothetical protein LEP1GSC171_2466 [Leptospira santarosai str. HAI1380]
MKCSDLLCYSFILLKNLSEADNEPYSFEFSVYSFVGK